MIAEFHPRGRTAIAAIFLCSATSADPRRRGRPQSRRQCGRRCAALSGAGSGATKVDSAALTEAKPLAVAPGGPTPAARISPATPPFCRVLGHIDPTDPKAPPIRFQLNLPLQWNGRTVQYGGGGFNGIVITGLGLPPAAPFDSASPLAQGICDLRHQFRPRDQTGRAAAAVCRQRRGLRQFCARLLQEGARRAVMLIERAYGAKPERMYFVGSSEGGREGLTMAQRYPNDFDGIFARVPVINWVGLQHAGTRAGLATLGDGWIRPAQVKLVHDAVLAACDAQDGIADGLVQDAVGCKARFACRQTALRRRASGDSASASRRSPPFERCKRHTNSRSARQRHQRISGLGRFRRGDQILWSDRRMERVVAGRGTARAAAAAQQRHRLGLRRRRHRAHLRARSRISMSANTGRRILPTGCARSRR